MDESAAKPEGNADHMGAWSTGVSQVRDDDVYLRGYRISEIIRHGSFAEAYYLLATGRLATPAQARVLEAVLCCVLDYGLQKPGTVAARVVVSTNPAPMVGIAAAMLAGGEHTMDAAYPARFIQAAHDEFVSSGLRLEEFAQQVVTRCAERRERIPGFGHPVYRGVDPRSAAMRDVAEQHGLVGERLLTYEAIHRAFTAEPARADLPINDVGMAAAVLLELGFPPQQMAGVLAASSIPGLMAHIDEEISSATILRAIPRPQSGYTGAEAREFPVAGRDTDGPQR